MPDRGLLDRSSVHAATIMPGGEAWTLRGVRLAQLTFEVDQQTALESMPADLNRPVPCYARLLVLDAPESPIGPFAAALLFVGGRHRMLGKNLLIDSVVQGDAAGMEAAFGGRFNRGTVSLDRSGDTVRAVIATEEHGLGALRLPAPAPIEPSMLRWDPWLGFARAGDVIELVELTPRLEASAAFLSKGATFELAPGLPRSHHWRGFRNLNTISACYVEGDMVLPRPEVQQAVA
jgi:hypothetical protein